MGYGVWVQSEGVVVKNEIDKVVRMGSQKMSGMVVVLGEYSQGCCGALGNWREIGGSDASCPPPCDVEVVVVVGNI